MTAGQLVPPVGDDDHVAGPTDAPVTLVEYGDFECPYCAMAYPIVKSLQRRLGKRLRLVFRNFPLRQSHPHAQHAAESAEAAGAQGAFWPMHDRLFEGQHALEDADLLRYARALSLDAPRVERELADGTHTRRVRDHFRGGVRSGVNGTPTFFINSVRFDGDWLNGRELADALEHAAAHTVAG